MSSTIRMPSPGGDSPPGGGADLDDAQTTMALGPRLAHRCPSCSRVFSGDARFCPYDGDPLVAAPDWDPRADPLIGTVVDGRYQVLGVLGEGGMGTVYEVRHAALDRRFALKVLRRELAADPELSARFIREAKAAAAIGHVHIVAVSDFGEVGATAGAPSCPYFVMEMLAGHSLATEIASNGVLAPARGATVFRQCASALAAAHAAGVIHRDIKPDNIFLVRQGEQEIIKVLDFGVAKIAGSGRLTRAGMVFGTPHYMSPEQAGGHPVDERSDIYSLGIVMYECFTGRVPFEDDTYMGVLTKHMFAEPEPIERFAPDPKGIGPLSPIVMRCLQKDPGARFGSMGEIAAALETAANDPSAARVASIGPMSSARSPMRLRAPSPRSASRPPSAEASSGTKRVALRVVALGALLVGLAGVAYALSRSSRGPASAQPPAPPTELPAAMSATEPPTAAPAVSTVEPAPPSAAASPTAPAKAAAPLSPPHASPAAVRSNPATSVKPVTPPPSAPSNPRRGGGDLIDPWGP